MDKAELLGGGGLETAEVEIPRIGKSVTVRGMTRMEALLVGKLDGAEKMEPQAIAYAMVDPVLTLKEAEQWVRSASVREVKAVVQEINRLSGMGGEKEAAKSVPDRGRRAAV